MIRIWCAGKTKLGPLRMTMANFTLVGLENQAGKTKDWWVRRTGYKLKSIIIQLERDWTSNFIDKSSPWRARHSLYLALIIFLI